MAAPEIPIPVAVVFVLLLVAVLVAVLAAGQRRGKDKVALPGSNAGTPADAGLRTTGASPGAGLRTTGASPDSGYTLQQMVELEGL